MPTTGELDVPSNERVQHTYFQESCRSWTDDLPICPFTDVGTSKNVKYIDRREEHPFEDKSFHFRYDNDTFFYGVFDGHVGTRAVNFASQRMPAEILLGQLKGKETDKEIREVLHQAFMAVEKSFFQDIDDLLAEKENLRLQLQGLRNIEAIEKYPDAVKRLNTVTEEIQSGATAVVALIHKNKLYVANVGDCRAVLCQEDKNGKINILQLSSDHIFSNEDEILRLSELGIDSQKLIEKAKRGIQNYTRCIGNYGLKGGYKDFDNLSEAEEEPFIAEPSIVGGINIDESFRFLLLMSDGIYKSLEEAANTENVNDFIANIIMAEYEEQSSLTGVAQKVVTNVSHIHQDAFKQNNGPSKCCDRRDDITLLVRNFNSVIIKESCQIQEIHSETSTLSGVPSISASYEQNTFDDKDIQANDPTSLTSTSLTNSSDTAEPPILFTNQHPVSLDDEGRIRSYVDFSDFYSVLEEAYKEGKVPKSWLSQNR